MKQHVMEREERWSGNWKKEEKPVGKAYEAFMLYIYTPVYIQYIGVVSR